MTPAFRRNLASRIKEHGVEALILMVDWITGCRCGGERTGGTKCRACDWLQPGGYTHPKTYLRPDNCSEYIDLARQADAKRTTPEVKPVDAANDPRRTFAIMAATYGSRYERLPLVGENERETQTLKLTVKLLGGRDAVTANLKAAEAAWPRAWAEAQAEIARKLEAVR